MMVKELIGTLKNFHWDMEVRIHETNRAAECRIDSVELYTPDQFPSYVVICMELDWDEEEPEDW